MVGGAQHGQPLSPSCNCAHWAAQDEQQEGNNYRGANMKPSKNKRGGYGSSQVVIGEELARVAREAHAPCAAKLGTLCSWKL